MSKSFLLISVIKVAPWRKHSGKLKETGGKTQLKDFEIYNICIILVYRSKRQASTIPKIPKNSPEEMLHSAMLIDGESASNPGFSRGSIINLGIPWADP